ncbi:response regulator [Methylomagnum ishizawai]|uniref:response regulator n=1 Tax=Methylomagnum ishizawai TaxID=1760988 RepID=UPI001C323AE7|nr:response regulator [Methylomagnum ishizawai]BBL76176.1 hypothetical protein MishRS11D_32740 [Methylomagnum ishizawai]
MRTPSPKPPRAKVAKTFCTTTEAADRLGVSVRTAQLWAENGLLRAWKTEGGHRRITLESLERLLASEEFRSLDRGEPPQKPERKPRLRVLVVEDEPNLLMLYQMRLRKWRMAPDTVFAKNGFEALVRIGLEQPHLLITDLLMPSMDGFEMLRKLRALPELADMEVVVVTGLSVGEVEERGGLPDDILVLGKPIPFDQIENIATNLAIRRDLQVD